MKFEKKKKFFFRSDQLHLTKVEIKNLKLFMVTQGVKFLLNLRKVEKWVILWSRNQKSLYSNFIFLNNVSLLNLLCCIITAKKVKTVLVNEI